MWTWIIISILLIVIYSEITSLKNQIKTITEERGVGFSQTFHIYANEAIMYSDMVKNTSGIKALIDGKEYEDFDNRDKTSYAKINKEIGKKARVRVTYLASDDIFITQNGSQIPMISSPRNNTIYYETVYGDTDGEKEHIDLIIKRRFVKINDKHEYVISVYYEELKGDLPSKGRKTTLLFNFPYSSLNETDETMKQRGFTIERQSGDVYTDSFEEMQSIPERVTYTQNRASVFIICE